MHATKDTFWMQKAIVEATSKGNKPSQSPIGAILVLGGRLIASEHNRYDELHDATAHAEMLTIRKAGAVMGNANLCGATLYSTLQPCGMCTMAAIWSKV